MNEEKTCDEWELRHIGCCGTCKYQEGVCVNPDSDMVGEVINDEDGCADWQRRK